MTARRSGYVGSVVVGRRRVWSSAPQGTREDAERAARGMTRQYTYEGGKSRTGLKVSTSVRRVGVGPSTRTTSAR